MSRSSAPIGSRRSSLELLVGEILRPGMNISSLWQELWLGTGVLILSITAGRDLEIGRGRKFRGKLGPGFTRVGLAIDLTEE